MSLKEISSSMEQKMKEIGAVCTEIQKNGEVISGF